MKMYLAVVALMAMVLVVIGVSSYWASSRSEEQVGDGSYQIISAGTLGHSGKDFRDVDLREDTERIDPGTYRTEGSQWYDSGMKVWLGYPVRIDVFISADLVNKSTGYALYELHPDFIESVVTSHELEQRLITAEILYPPEFNEANPHAPAEPDAKRPLGDAKIALVGWDDQTLEGPYEISDYSVGGASPVVSFSGEMGVRFDDEILEFSPVPSDPNRPPWSELVEHTPWSLWQNEIDLVEVMRGQAIGAKTGSELRRAIEAWGFTVAPLLQGLRYGPLPSNGLLGPGSIRAPNDRYLEYRYVPQYLSLYPLVLSSLSINQPPADYPLTFTTRYEWADAGGLILKAGVRYLVLARVSNAQDGIGEDFEINTPDAFNQPGDYQTRRIALEVDTVLGDRHREILSSGELGTHTVYLDQSVFDEAGTEAIIYDRVRWELQNTSIEVGLVLYPGNPRLIPNQIITFEGSERLGNSPWRVVRSEHRYDGVDGEATALDLVLWQGRYVRP